MSNDMSMTTARDVIAEVFRDEEDQMMYGDDYGNADRILSALHSAGYIIIRDRTDPEGGIPGRLPLPAPPPEDKA